MSSWSFTRVTLSTVTVMFRAIFRYKAWTSFAVLYCELTSDTESIYSEILCSYRVNFQSPVYFENGSRCKLVVNIPDWNCFCICGVSKVAVNKPVSVATNDWIFIEQTNRERRDKQWLWPHLKFCPGIKMGWLRKSRELQSEVHVVF